MTEEEEWNTLWSHDPTEVATSLHNRGITSIEYKELVWEREKRLLFFQGQGIPVLIENATKLRDFGKEVYKKLTDLERPYLKDKRKIGFYWVKTYDTDWFVCEWASGKWWIPGHEVDHDDSDFIEIIETRILTPDEADGKRNS